MKFPWFVKAPPVEPLPERAPPGYGQETALYLYLKATLQSPYFRQMLEDGAARHKAPEHGAEAVRAR